MERIEFLYNMFSGSNHKLLREAPDHITDKYYHLTELQSNIATFDNNHHTILLSFQKLIKTKHNKSGNVLNLLQGKNEEDKDTVISVSGYLSTYMPSIDCIKSWIESGSTNWEEDKKIEVINCSRNKLDSILKTKEEHPEAIIWLGYSIYYIGKTNTLVAGILPDYTLAKIGNIKYQLLLQTGLTLTLTKFKHSEQDYIKEVYNKIFKENNIDYNYIKQDYIKNNITISDSEYKELFQFSLSAKIKEHLKATLKEQIINKKIEIKNHYNSYMRENENLTNLLFQEETVKYNAVTKIDKLFKGLEMLQNVMKKITSYKIETNDNNFIIKLSTNWLPVTMIDINMLKGILENDDTYWRCISKSKELCKMVVDDPEKYMYAVGPTSVLIDLTPNIDNERKRLSFVTLKGTGNGHANYNGGHGCLGTFEPVIKTAITELDYSKIIFIIIQYLQTIGVIDYAGRNTIQTPTILEKQEDETYKIIYCYYNHDLEGEIINYES